MSQKIFFGVAIFCCTLIFCSILPGTLLYEFGYKPEIAWSERAVETKCFIQKYNLESINCGKKSFACYVAILTVSFVTNNGQNISDVNLTACDDSFASAAEVNRCVATRFSIGTNVTCFYDASLPRDVRLVKSVESIFYAYVFVAFFVGIFFAICFFGIFITSTSCGSQSNNVEKEMKFFS